MLGSYLNPHLLQSVRGYTDVMGAATQLTGRSSVESMDAEIGVSEDGDDEFTLHSLLAAGGEDVDTAAARDLDWDDLLLTLDDQRKHVLKATAEGVATNDIAAALGVSAPRVCQVRESIGRYVVDAWGTNGLVDVTTPTQWRAGLRAGAERRAGRYERAK